MDNKKILYLKDFLKPQALGLETCCLADMYEVEPDMKTHIQSLNELLNKLQFTEETDFAHYMMELEKIKNEAVSYAFRHYAHIGDIVIANNGAGLEIGVKAELKKEYILTQSPRTKQLKKTKI